MLTGSRRIWLAPGRAVGVGREQLVVVRPADVLEHQRKQVGAELEGPAEAGEPLERRPVQEAGQRRT